MNNYDKTIFITIASCREYYLIHTIKSALAAAKNPNRVFFGIFNTVLEKDKSYIYDLDRPELAILKSPNVVYTEFHAQVPLGIGFSRMNAALMADRDHDFVFQIDAHTIFDKGWDETLINNYKIAEKYAGEKVILSNMTHGFNYDLNNKEKLTWKWDEPINFDNFDSGENVTAMPSIRTDGRDGNGKLSPSMVGIAWVDGGPWNDNKIVVDKVAFHEGNCVFAAMMFYPFKYLKDLLHDPFDPFSGDQINFSLRLISRGFRIFHFYKPVFVTLDKYQPEVDSDYQWKDACKSGREGNLFIRYLKGVANKNHNAIFNGKYFGYWGSPDQDSLLNAKKIMGIENYSPE